MTSWHMDGDDALGKNHALEKKLSLKDAECANLRTQLIKRAREIEELQSTLNDTIHKLGHETERAFQLENICKASSENLRNERIATQNVQATVADANQRLKDQELERKELHMTIEALSHRIEEAQAENAKLAREKLVAESRTRELETHLRQFTAASQASSIPAPRHQQYGSRRRSSSLSPGLQQELNDTHSILLKKENDLRLVNEKLGRAQTEVTKLANEKAAMEKTMQAKMQQLEASLEEKQDELEFLRAQRPDGDVHANEREEELLKRIDEDDAKMTLLLADLDNTRNALRKAECRLQTEHAKVVDGEARQIELVRQKEEVLDELQEAGARIQQLTEVVRDEEIHVQALTQNARDLRDQLKVAQHRADALESDMQQMMTEKFDTSTVHMSSSPLRPHDEHSRQLDEAPVAYIERLLTAIERLRGERDGLRIDLYFLEAESRFALEAAEAKLAAGLAHGRDTQNVEAQRSDADTWHEQKLAEREEEIRRLSLAATASIVALGHLHSQATSADKRHDAILLECASVKTELQDAVAAREAKERTITELSEQLSDVEMRCNVTSLDLEAAAAQRTNLFKQIKRLEAKEVEWALEIRRTKEAQRALQTELGLTSGQLVKLSQSLEEVESQRNSLGMQVTNLQSELEAARQELLETQDRYSALQNRQLSSMSSGEVTRVLREQIQELEERVLRRTEQIGIHQHDIKRMEMNLHLQEERLEEMTEELEMSAAEKAAMVEDCADAREARDEALRKVEWLEVEVEVREDQLADAAEQLSLRESELVTMVELLTGSMAKAKEASSRALQNSRNTAGLDQRAKQADDAGALAVADLERLREDHKRTVRLLDEKTSMLEIAERRAGWLEDSATQVTIALAVSQVDLKKARGIDSQRARQVDGLRAELDALNCRHSRAVSDAEAQLAARTCDLEARLDQLRGESAAAAKSHQDAVREFEELLRETQHTLLEPEEIERLRAHHSKEIGTLQEKLGEASMELQQVHQKAVDLEARCQQLITSRADLEALHLKATEDLSRSRKELDVRLAEIGEKSFLIQQLEETVTDQSKKISELQVQLDESSEALRGFELKMKEDISHHAHEQEHSRSKLQLATERCQRAESMQAQLQLQVDSARGEIETLQSEKETLQMETTSLQAEIQRAFSLQRFLESQVKESEHKITTLAETIEQNHRDMVKTGNAERAAQIALSFQKSEHARVLSSLQNELATLRSKPNLESIVIELKEKNHDMEEMLRAKCAEVEENDDRFIELLKEKKKLTSKIESLSRRVVSLQQKLADCKDHISVPTTQDTTNPRARAPPVHSTPTAPVPVAPQTWTPTTKTCDPSPSKRGSHPVIPGLSKAAQLSGTSGSRTRTNSGPSSLSRPQTPERQAVPVSHRPRTPEGHLFPLAMPEVAQQPSSSGPSIGKKRPPPEEFESLPPQGFTVESLPADHTPTTPRTRRALQGHSGFTPVRHNVARPTIPLPPRRRSSLPKVDLITDVTNNPRSLISEAGQEAKPAKRSWLGKIRAQPPTRIASTRPELLARTTET